MSAMVFGNDRRFQSVAKDLCRNSPARGDLRAGPRPSPGPRESNAYASCGGADFWRRSEKPTAPNPSSIIAHVAGSGTLGVSRVKVPLMFAEPGVGKIASFSAILNAPP